MERSDLDNTLTHEAQMIMNMGMKTVSDGEIRTG